MYWAIFGNLHARQMFYLPIFNSTWWREALLEIRWYLYCDKRPKKSVGQTPLAKPAVFCFITPGGAL